MNEEYKRKLLDLLKGSLGISTNARDTFLTGILESIIAELEDEKGIVIDSNDMNIAMFIVDYADFRYSKKDTANKLSMPRHLQWRLHNIIIHKG